ALGAVTRHPVHVAVKTLRQPVAQEGLVLREFDARDAAALETGLARERLDAQRERGRIGHVRSGQGSVGGGRQHAASIESARWTPTPTPAACRFTTRPRCVPWKHVQPNTAAMASR